jgi:coenzyme Q-binding protein COQ10
MPTHAETRLLPYTPEQLFDLVADIERYPEFLPWCVGARVRSREGELILGDLLIGWKMVHERFTSRVHLHRPGAIEVEYAEGPFNYLKNYWKFIPQPGGGTLLDFHVDFEIRSRFLSGVIATLFNEAVRRMVAAFETRARELYGAKPI